MLLFKRIYHYRWWDKAKLLQYVDSQEELDKYQKDLNRTLSQHWIEPYWSFRKLAFLGRVYLNYFML